MSDLVSRAEVIGIIEAAISDEHISAMASLYMARAEVSALPSAELVLQTPQTYGKSINPSNTEVVADYISRADVIRLLVNKYKFTTSEATEILSELPSAEAEPKRVLQGYCKGAVCRWWNPQVEGCNRCVFVKDEYTHPSAEADSDDLIIKGAKGIQDGLYNIKDGKLFKYKARGGTVRTYEIEPVVRCKDCKHKYVSGNGTT